MNNILNILRGRAMKQVLAVFAVTALLIGGLMLLVAWQNDDLPNFMTGASIEALPVEELDGPLSVDALLSQQTLEPINNMNPKATFNTNFGPITLELFADSMPVTTDNFIKLAEEGFYDGTKFHRVINGFMIQGGDPNSRGDDSTTYGQGGPGYNIQDEFVEGEHLTNVRGTIAMANTGQPNSGGSQFFINLVDNTQLDFDKEPLTSKHPVFGKVLEGMSVVDEIALVETGPRDVPVEPVIIESITIVAGGE